MVLAATSQPCMCVPEAVAVLCGTCYKPLWQVCTSAQVMFCASIRCRSAGTLHLQRGYLSCVTKLRHCIFDAQRCVQISAIWRSSRLRCSPAPRVAPRSCSKPGPPRLRRLRTLPARLLMRSWLRRPSHLPVLPPMMALPASFSVLVAPLRRTHTRRRHQRATQQRGARRMRLAASLWCAPTLVSSLLRRCVRRWTGVGHWQGSCKCCCGVACSMALWSPQDHCHWCTMSSACSMLIRCMQHDDHCCTMPDA